MCNLKCDKVNKFVILFLMGFKKRHSDRVDGRSQETGLTNLMAELQASWREQGRPRAEEVRALPSRDTSGFSQYIGRPVLSKTLRYITGKWQTAAADHDITFGRVRPPIGLRYLGYTTLRAVKYCSRHGITEDGEPIPNVLFRSVNAVGQIVEEAYADTVGLDTEAVGRNFEGFGTRLVVRRYPQEEGMGYRFVLGVELSEIATTMWAPAEKLVAERQYFLTRYDPFYSQEETREPNLSMYVPLGWVEGLEDTSDSRFQAMALMCQEILPIKVVLGPVQLIEEGVVSGV